MNELTKRETAYLALLAKGCTVVAIAKGEYLVPKTLNNYLKVVRDKLGVDTNAAAVAVWVRRCDEQKMMDVLTLAQNNLRSTPPCYYRQGFENCDCSYSVIRSAIRVIQEEE